MYTPNDAKILNSIQQYLNNNVTIPFMPKDINGKNINGIYCVKYQTSDLKQHSKLLTSEQDAWAFYYYIRNCIRNEFLTKYDIQPRRTR